MQRGKERWKGANDIVDISLCTGKKERQRTRSTFVDKNPYCGFRVDAYLQVQWVTRRLRSRRYALFYVG